MVLVCLMISKHHVTKRACDFTGRGPLVVSHHHAKFSGLGHCSGADIMVLLCHVKHFKFEITAYGYEKSINFQG